MRDTPPFPIEPVNAKVFAEMVRVAKEAREPLLAILRECLPWIQKSRFGNPQVDGLLDRMEAAILESEGK